MCRSSASVLRTMFAKARRACCSMVLTAAGSSPSSPRAARSSRVQAGLLLCRGARRSGAPRNGARRRAPPASGAGGGTEHIGTEDTQVVGPLEGGRVGHRAVAHAALHLADGLILLTLHQIGRASG